MTKKKCSKCKEEKNIVDFHKHCRSNDGYRSKCKKCRSNPRPPLIANGEKKCPKCGKIKPVTEYYKDNNTGTSISSRCKECVKGHVKKWRTENPETHKIMRDEYVKNNAEKIKKANRKYHTENKNKIRDRIKSDPGFKAKKSRWDKSYRKKHKVRLNKDNAKYRRNRMATDIEFRLLCVMRGRVCHALKAKEENRYKYRSTKELIGTTISNLIKHLESLFAKGMTWDNYGLHGWHVDHIKPCAAFNLTDQDQQKECFHYTNLQPLWAEDNLKKGSKYADQNY